MARGDMTGDNSVGCTALRWAGYEFEVRDVGRGSPPSCTDATSPETPFLDGKSWDGNSCALDSGVQRMRAEDSAWSGGVGLGLGLGIGAGEGPSVQPPISPSYPFSRMQLQDGLSPAGLKSVSEECGGWVEDGIMIPPLGENGDDIFGMDIDLEFALAGEDLGMVEMPALVMPEFIPDNGFSKQEGRPVPSPSPSPDFRVKRRHTDSDKTNKTTWHAEPLPTFPEGKYNFLGVGSSAHSASFLSPSFSSLPISSTGTTPTPPLSEGGGSLVRRTSSKRRRSEKRSSSRCVFCTIPDRPKDNQKIFLQNLPCEILLLIFEFSFISPTKFPKCEHRRNLPSGHISRRATAPIFTSSEPQPAQPLSSDQNGAAAAASTEVKIDESDPPRLPDHLRIYSAKTLLYISLTCTRFNEILMDSHVDATFWRSAARFCWNWLPENLCDVQGREESHQTSWRNLVGVFMRSENGLIKQKGGGKGGVESFGGNKGCVPATLWKDEQARRAVVGSEGMKKKKKLLLVCAQPGPDQLQVFPDKEGGYTLCLSLRAGKDSFVTLDEYGTFGKKPARRPGGLKWSTRGIGYFPPDIYEVEGDRYQLVKVRLRREASISTFSSVKAHPKPAVKEIVTWDLNCLPEYVADPKASVARCTSWEGTLVFNLFTHGGGEDQDGGIEALMDPPEDPRIFCVESLGYPGCHSTGKATATPMSEKKRGKMRASSVPLPGEQGTVYRWQQLFTYDRAGEYSPAVHLHYVICNLKLNSTKAVALIRWNIRTTKSNEELVDREFRIVDLKTGGVLRTLSFPNLYWDHRHHDMSVEYNLMRHQKMSRLYNHLGPGESMGAGNRCTRIHTDAFVLTETTLISGSHDYCNWVWDLSSPPPPPPNPPPVFTASHNEAGLHDPFTVLDDFYWSSAPEPGKELWNTNNERAGWWVRTPNQVLCFWHNISISPEGRFFAVCRPGKLFVWDLLNGGGNKVVGFTNIPPGAPASTRWLGRLSESASGLKHLLRHWFVWENVLPEQGLWLLYDDFTTVYLDRDDILSAAGLGKRAEWMFHREDFEMSEDEGEHGQCQHVHGRRRRSEFDDDCSEGDDCEDYYETSSDFDEEGEEHEAKKKRRTEEWEMLSFEAEEDLTFR
ncbi:unnamed protein product [Tuber melanosporum]|uniref:(Perigord truffle) hypothetical protein n=1 Tax=Tuber melanosporum (strain Mel28) TaxID=656061 RepID=D5GLP1_TUBMM|nr:uncharacterized protein GSTUM_00010294001 [Tuber melanosporum]CAZ85434.1 unnamed protein product [Tuber melanosporum]